MAAFSDNPALRDHWYAVANETELDGGPVGRTLLNQNFVLYRDAAGAVIAAPDRCPHREAPLSAGEVKHGTLTCAYHGWSFGAGGRCVRIPSANPDFPIPEGAHLTCIHTRVRFGLIWVCPGDGTNAELPAIAEDDDPAYRRFNNPVELWRTSATRMTDNFLDVSHFPWVHRGTFGSNQDERVPDIHLEVLDGGFYGYAYDLVVEPPRNEWSARPQASRCAASARGRIGHTSRADNGALSRGARGGIPRMRIDGRLWARPSGGRRNAPRGVAAA